MAGLVLPNTFTSQPTTYVPLDSKDPLSRDLCFLVNSALGPYDLVAEKYASTWNGSRVATQKGITLSGTGAAAKLAEWSYNPVNPTGTGSVTYAVLMNPVSEARGAVAIGYIMNGSPFRQVSMLTNFDGNAGSASAGMFTIQSYAGSNQGYANAASVIDGNFHLFVGRYRVGVDAHVWVDGVNRTSANNIPGGIIGIDASMRLSVGSESYATSRTVDAEIPFAAAWNRALSDAEIVALTRNIWARQKAQPARVWIPVSAASSDGVGSASGSATVSGVGSSVNAQPGTASGVSTVSGVGSSAAASVASSSGTGTASGVGQAVIESVASASGVATVSGVGTSGTGSSGSAAGSASVAGVGAAITTSTGSSSGLALTSGVVASTATSTGASSGASTVSGVGDSVQAGSAVGNASGTSAVSGIGASVAAAVGTASGSSAVTGRGDSTGGEVEDFGGDDAPIIIRKRKKKTLREQPNKHLEYILNKAVEEFQGKVRPTLKLKKNKELEVKEPVLGPTPSEDSNSPEFEGIKTLEDAQKGAEKVAQLLAEYQQQVRAMEDDEDLIMLIAEFYG